ncbi:hypothetical protein BHM09_16660 [Salmonella enterica]|nr:hypothetical protein [Salmonella enterica]
MLTSVTYCSKLLGLNEGHLCPSPKAAFSCSNSFLTNLLLSCRVIRLTASPFQGQRKRCSKR